MDGIHPTPLYELLDRAEQLLRTSVDEGSTLDEHQSNDYGECRERGGAWEVPKDKGTNLRLDLRRLVPAMDVALANLAKRGLDVDGNGGIVLQKLGQVYLACADADSVDGHREAAKQKRQRAVRLLKRAKPLMTNAMDAEEVDLSELCVITAMQIGLAEARLSGAD
mmetsp:Transcript_84766/g.197117  ORF Transcript_84766/g.197117 Transcript_84766/m.197117 type:complete len:166 (+) Transcript_84766:634-1131(+)|eukprot:CAMPEP_0171074726 /NCGR_PEP_ID=MMETSP0766_2-20121228/12327_1 /TAXON_ID=439317 /ORGANISM="Gambierdiscus australes, Strain CAWD 149" /LENGTH=165 /DNA_ID=CAMNT_0011531537 /DNA_START=594 /DNA_END=1091 /DNA_ORIENTATION=+